MLQVANHLPIAVPLHLIANARWQHLNGQSPKAVSLLKDAVEQAQHLEMSFYEKQATYFVDMYSNAPMPEQSTSSQHSRSKMSPGYQATYKYNAPAK